MDFLSLFQPLNFDEKKPKNEEVAQIFRGWMPKAKPSTMQVPSMPIMPELPTGKAALDFLHDIPLEKRMKMLVDTGMYQDLFKSIVERQVKRVKEEELKLVKKEHPELADKIGLRNIAFTPNVMDEIMDYAAEVSLEAIFKKEEIKRANLHLLDPRETLTNTDKSVLKICIHFWRHNPNFLAEQYGVKTGAFQAMIAKGAMDLADMMGQAFKSDPRTIVYYGIKCCRGTEGFDRGEMALAVDPWVAKWLDPKMMKALVQERRLMPLEGTKTQKPTAEDIRRTQRYQDGFKKSLPYYFMVSPTQSQKVFQMVLPYITKMDQTMQEQMWAILFKKYEVDPSIRDEVGQFMASFLALGPDQKAQKTMYRLFVKTVPPARRADVLGHMPTRALKRYWNTFKQIYKNIPYIALQTDEGKTHLAWHMFYQRELSDEQMKKILNEADPKQQRDFLFSPKRYMDKDLFSHMCGVFSKSQFYFWQWVRSHKNVRDFNKSLAEIYLTLPPSVREDRNYVVAMNNHFDLVRECALKGDTASLSALKKVLGADVFWQSLTREPEGEISGIRALCRQGKRGLLKLMADWPIEKKQALFMQVDLTGRTLLADCIGSLARLVPQEVFKQAYQRDFVPDFGGTIKDEPVETEQAKTPKKKVQRQIIRIPAFESHMDRYLTNPKLLREVEEMITTLSQMDKAEMQAELREDWKTGGGIDRNPCAVKDIRGNNYRLGYLPRGDVDKGTGQIAFLFFLTHAQYDIFLNRQGDQAVRTAIAMMDAQKPVPNTPTLTGPTGPGGGNDGR